MRAIDVAACKQKKNESCCEPRLCRHHGEQYKYLASWIQVIHSDPRILIHIQNYGKGFVMDNQRFFGLVSQVSV